MNAEKLKRLQAQVRIGGKGTPRRKKKVVHQTAATDDKKLQSSLKKLSVSTIPGIEEVNIIKDDLSVIHFNNPKAQASLAANTFAITGHGENKKVVEMLPEILPQLGQDTVLQLRRFANNMAVSKTLTRVAEEEDVPTLVGNFDEASKNEAPSAVPLLEIQKTKESANIIDATEISKAKIEETLDAKAVTGDKPHSGNVSENQALAQPSKTTQPTLEVCRNGKEPELVQGKDPEVCLKESLTTDNVPHQKTPTVGKKIDEPKKETEKKMEPTAEITAATKTVENKDKQPGALVEDPKVKKEEVKEEKSKQTESTSKTKPHDTKHVKGKSQQIKAQDGKPEKTQQSKQENIKSGLTNQQSPKPAQETPQQIAHQHENSTGACPTDVQPPKPVQDTPQQVAHQHANKIETVTQKQKEVKSEEVTKDVSPAEPQAADNKGVKSEDVSPKQEVVGQKTEEPKPETTQSKENENLAELKDATSQSKDAKIEEPKSDVNKSETATSDKAPTVDIAENKTSQSIAPPIEEENRAIFVEIKTPAEVPAPKTPEADKSNMQLVEKKNLQIVEKPDMPVSIVQPPIIPASAQPPSTAMEEKSTESKNEPEILTAEKDKSSAPIQDNKSQEAKPSKQEKPDALKKNDGKKGEKGKAKTPPPQKKGDKPQQKGSGKQTPQGKRTPATSESELKIEDTVPKKAVEDKSVKAGKHQAKTSGKQTPQGKRTPATSESEPKGESVEKKSDDKTIKAAEKSQPKQGNQGKETPITSESDAKCDQDADKQATSITARPEESSGNHQHTTKQQMQGKSPQPAAKPQQQQKKTQPKKQENVKTTGGEQTKPQKSSGKPQQKPSAASGPNAVKKEVVEQEKKAN